MTSSTCGVFQAEASRGPRRGKLSVIVVLHNVIFYMIASWLTLGTAQLNSSAQWRLPLALQVHLRHYSLSSNTTDHCRQIFPATVLVTLLTFVPESPRWLLMHDRTEEALDSLRRYSGKDLDVHDPIVQDQYKSIQSAIDIERLSKISFKQVVLCRDRSGHLKRLLLGCGGQFMQVRKQTLPLFHPFYFASLF